MEQFSPLTSILARILGPHGQHGDLQHLESRTLMSGVPTFHALSTTPHHGPAIVQQLDHQPIALAAAAAPAPVVLAAPSAVKATYAVTSGRGMITVTWTNNTPTANGYSVYRAVGGSTEFVLAARIASATTKSFTEAAGQANTIYSYKIVASTATATTPASSPVSLTTPMSAPSRVAAQIIADTNTGALNVAVFWYDADPNITGFAILRSEAGGAYVQIAQTADRSFTDKTTRPGTVYNYQVKALSGTRTSPASAAAPVTTAPGTPTSAAASVANGRVTLTWADSDPKVTGYSIWRSSDGSTFTRIAAVTGASTKSYLDTTLSAGAVAFYKVLAHGPGGTSSYSNIAEARLPANDQWSLTTRFSNELILNSPVAGDTFSISQSASTLLISANGADPIQRAVTTGGFFIYLRGGNTTLTVDSTVTTNITVQSINGLNDVVSVASETANVWIDAADTFTGNTPAHRVGDLVGGVSKSMGASLPNPTDAKNTVAVNMSLFGTAISYTDANQGQLGDCYFISTLASLANSTPTAITSSVVDMGDGTYTVQFFRNGVAQYYRVNNQLASTGAGLSTLLYANPRSSGHIWTAVLEKAFAHYRRGTNTYASLNGGYFGEVNDALNIRSVNFNPAASTDANLFSLLSAKLASGKSIEFATSNISPNLVRSHGYSLLSVAKVNGVNKYTVRNPWGASGNTLESSSGIAVLTYGQLISNFAGGTMAA